MIPDELKKWTTSAGLSDRFASDLVVNFQRVMQNGIVHVRTCDRIFKKKLVHNHLSHKSYVPLTNMALMLEGKKT